MKLTIAIFFYFAATNAVLASDVVIWRQELIYDSNSICTPGAIAVDSVNNEVIILGTSERLHTREANFWLWKIDTNGNVTHKKSLGLASKYDLLTVGPFGIKAAIKPDTGDIMRLKIDDVNSSSLSIADRNMQDRTIKLGARRNRLVHDMISCQNDGLLFVGQEDLNGIVEKIDLAGNVVWGKIFNHGQTNILSSVACTPSSDGFYVTGLSISIAGKMAFADPATICVLHYDSNGKLKANDFFEGGIALWPSSLPKVICLPSGTVLVVYDKSKNGKATELYVKTYTQELTPLNEKQILQTKEDGPPASFDVCALPEDRFVLAGVVNYSDLRVYEYKTDGTILQSLELNGEVRAKDVYVDYLAGKIFVAFATRPKENTKGTKIELLALKPYKIN
jgi:hypothetical protein